MDEKSKTLEIFKQELIQVYEQNSNLNESEQICIFRQAHEQEILKYLKEEHDVTPKNSDVIFRWDNDRVGVEIRPYEPTVEIIIEMRDICKT